MHSSLELNASERTYYAELIIAFSQCMKEHLRRKKLALSFPLDDICGRIEEGVKQILVKD
ncbi:MAG: hypothetical protein ACKO7P_14315 [Bacteroidota bacterium]